jgi:hypothetical protein
MAIMTRTWSARPSTRPLRSDRLSGVLLRFQAKEAFPFRTYTPEGNRSPFERFCFSSKRRSGPLTNLRARTTEASPCDGFWPSPCQRRSGPVRERQGRPCPTHGTLGKVLLLSQEKIRSREGRQGTNLGGSPLGLTTWAYVAATQDCARAWRRRHRAPGLWHCAARRRPRLPPGAPRRC